MLIREQGSIGKLRISNPWIPKELEAQLSMTLSSNKISGPENTMTHGYTVLINAPSPPILVSFYITE